jgi:hypothetical protein
VGKVYSQMHRQRDDPVRWFQFVENKERRLKLVVCKLKLVVWRRWFVKMESACKLLLMTPNLGLWC